MIYILITGMIIIIILYIKIHNTRACIKAVKDKITEVVMKQDKVCSIMDINQTEFVFKVNEVSYDVKILRVNPTNEVVITNKKTWILTKNKQVLIENKIKSVEKFIQKDTSHVKLIILHPYFSRLLMYINENEMKFVTSGMEVHGYYVIDFKQIESFKF